MLITSSKREPATTVTGRGQTSIPAERRREPALKPGQRLSWRFVSGKECLVRVKTPAEPANPLGAPG